MEKPTTTRPPRLWKRAWKLVELLTEEDVDNYQPGDLQRAIAREFRQLPIDNQVALTSFLLRSKPKVRLPLPAKPPKVERQRKGRGSYIRKGKHPNQEGR